MFVVLVYFDACPSIVKGTENSLEISAIFAIISKYVEPDRVVYQGLVVIA